VKLAIIGLIFAAGLSAQSGAPSKPEDVAPYGFQPGTVAGFAGVGAMHASGSGTGIHPTLGGGIELGFHKYLGVFGEGAWSRMSDSASACVGYYCAYASGKVNYYQVGGGLEIVGTNRSRFVPYGKFGGALVGAAATVSVNDGRFSGSASESASAPAILVAGGVRSYINRHWGIDAQVTGLRTVGGNGGSTIVAPTVGVFFQSK
jgi:hypothetical protein